VQSRGAWVTLTRPSSHGSLASNQIDLRHNGEGIMNKACLISLLALTALPLTASRSWAQCSNSNLSGTYAFTVCTVPLPTPP
jgi:hypothetical protein